MPIQILQNLNRQSKAFDLLIFLVDEELKLLQTSRPREVASVEFSIQELLRQIALERESMKRMVNRLHPDALSLTRIVEKLPLKTAAPIKTMLTSIRQKEQLAARKASVNAELSIALVEQSKKLLQFFHSKVTPKVMNTYSAAGRWKSQPTGATLFQGRL